MRAVFLDKDGTLVDDVPYNVDPDQVRLAPGAAEGLQLLMAAGYLLVVVSNQAGVAHGYFAEEALQVVEGHLQQLLAASGVRLDAFLYCPHHPEGIIPRYARVCDCRKPAPGLLRRAAHDYGIDLRRSWMIGDILHDVEAGRRAGCRTILIDNGNETEWQLVAGRLPHHIVADLAQAARVITALDGLAPPPGPFGATEREKRDSSPS